MQWSARFLNSQKTDLFLYGNAGCIVLIHTFLHIYTLKYLCAFLCILYENLCTCCTQYINIYMYESNNNNIIKGYAKIN